MKKIFILFILMMCIFLAAAKPSENTAIILPDSPLASESFAAEELADHIKKMTGKSPVIISENKLSAKAETAFYIGRTRKAAENKIDFAKFRAEQWQIASVDGGVLIGGGNAVGSLYGVYHYLEDICGIRWFTVYDTYIPKLQKLPIRDLKLSGEPAFRFRTIYTEYFDFDSRFLARNRMNGDFSNQKKSIFASIPYLVGPSSHSHCYWIKPAKYFKSHPEFFALQPNGKRDKRALCMTNPACRRTMTEEIRTAVRKRYAQASKNPLPSLQFVNISHMDNQIRCHCADCKKTAEKYKAFSGCDIEFINAAANELKKEFPNIIFVTLAYTYTEKPPVGIHAADNVSVQMCDTTSNVAVPITHKDNSFFLDALTKWSKICKNMTIWDYWITFNFDDMVLANELPCATVENTAADLRTMRRLGVPFFFAEMEYYTASSDVYDYKLYIYLKLLENPFLDLEKLSKEFADEFYGPAGKLFLEYRTKLAKVQQKWKPLIDWNPHFGRFTYLNFEFLQEMQELFDRGEKMLASDPVRLKRWQRARISLDRAVCFRFSYLLKEFLQTGKPAEKFPFDLKKCSERCKKAVLDTTYMRYDHRNIRVQNKNTVKDAERLKKTAETNIKRITDRFTVEKAVVPSKKLLPAELAEVPMSELHIFPLSSTFMFFENHKEPFVLTAEKDSLFGSVASYTFNPSKLKRMPQKSIFTFATYLPPYRKTIYKTEMPESTLDTPIWHWIKFKNIRLTSNNHLAFFSNWNCRFDVSSLAGPEHKLKIYDLWVRVKYTSFSPEKAKFELDTVILKEIKNNNPKTER